MKTRQLVDLGIPKGPCIGLAQGAIREYGKGHRVDRSELVRMLSDILADPDFFQSDEYFGLLAKQLMLAAEIAASYRERVKPAPYCRWGENLEEQSVQQMKNACRLPVSVAGALMPDAHLGYGLPIGGVLATQNAVIPYAVGVDIACRMKMSVLDLPVSTLEDEPLRLKQALEQETRFGIAANFKHKREHSVLDEDWSICQTLANNKDKAWKQLGTSGSGNHFVEYGVLTLVRADLGLEAGRYLALLSHSGSRGTGYQVASHYSRIAAELRPELPKELIHLAWLDLDTHIGQEYWQAMELMGLYAAANHAMIHHHMVKHLGAEVLLDVENHHNFAWKERHLGQDLIVHRKGATPADKGAIGIIPGTMATPGYVVRGKGNAKSLNSAAHGAGRAMSRTAANKRFNWTDTKAFLAERNVTLLSAGLDEAPMAYKDIEVVMAAQRDLVDTIACFEPRMVKMAPAGERPED